MENLRNKPVSMRRRPTIRLALGLVTLAGCASLENEEPAPVRRAEVSQTYAPLVGQDGDYTVTAANTVVNSYTTLGLGATQADKTINVTNVAALVNPTNGMPLKKGDLLLIYQAQGATIDTTDNPAQYGNITALNGAGSFEFVVVDSISGNSIAVGSCGGLRNAYPMPGKAQVVRVPQFNNLTVQAGGAIVAKAWDGQSGGVVAIHVANKTTLAGSIDVTAQGFRGGLTDAVSNVAGVSKVATMRTSDPMLGAEKGESIAGSADDYQTAGSGKYGRGAPANGGGGGNAHNAGGGGGGGGGNPMLWTGQGVMDGLIPGAAAWVLDQGYKDNGNKLTSSTGGGRGGYTYSRPMGMAPDPTLDGPGSTKWGADNRQDVGGIGGRPLDPNPGFQAFMGGGGGAGDQDNNSGGSGGNGGGVVILVSDTVTVPGAMTGFIRASGGDGADTTNSHNDAAGGGGGGGSILIFANKKLDSDVRLFADGGFGGSQRRAPSDVNEADGPGGGGGGGFVAHSTVGTPTVSTKGVTAGNTVGATLSKFPANGATNGNAGKSMALSRQPTIAGMPGYYPLCVPSDLEVQVTPPGAPVQPGQTASFNVSVTNKGENPAIGTDIVTTLPSGIPQAQITWTCTATGGATCAMSSGTGPLPTQADLPAGGSVQFAVKVPVPSMSAMATVSLGVSAQPPPGYLDPVPMNNSATGMAPIVGGTTVTPQSDLEVTATKSPENPTPGTETTVTINVKNLGKDAATRPVVVFSIPPGSTVTQAPPKTGDTNAQWNCVADGSTYTCTANSDLPAFTPAPPIVVKFKTPPDTAGGGTPQVVVSGGSPGSSDPNPLNNTTVIDVGPVKTRPTADLSLVVTKTPQTAGPGTEATFTLQVANKGPDTAQNPSVTFTVPPGSTVTQPAQGSGWACTRTASTFVCVTGALAPGSAPPITVKIVAPQPASSQTPAGSVAGMVGAPSVTDPNPANNSDSKPVAGNLTATGSDLSIRITADKTSPIPGDTVTYTAVAENRGPDTVQAPSVVINLPPGAKVTQAPQGDGWSCVLTNLSVLCTRPSVDKGAAPPITVQVQLPTSTSTGAPAGAPTTSAVVGAPINNDPDPSNNTSVIDGRPLTPRTNADLALSITKSPQGGGAGTDITYTVQASNKGPGEAANPSVTFSVPPGSTIVQGAQGQGWACFQSGYSFTCYLGATLKPGDAPPITVKVNTPAPATGAVAGVVNSPSTSDPDPLNNTASASVGATPSSGSDLSVRVSVDPSNPKSNTEATYTAEVSNAGPDPVKNPVVTILLPPGSDIVDGPRGDGWTCARETAVVVCTRDSVSQGSAPPVTVKVRLPYDPSGGAAAGRATVNAAGNNDPNLANNVASSELFRLTGGGFACSATGLPGAGGAAPIGALLSSLVLLLRRRRAPRA